MRKTSTYIMSFFLAVSFMAATDTYDAKANGATPTAQQQEERRVLRTPQTNRRRQVRGDRRRKPGVGNALAKSGRRYGRAGKSLARGSARLGKNVVVARPVRGGKEFGKGAGGFGKNVGTGTAYAGVTAGRTGKKIGRGTAATAKAGARGTKAVARGTGRVVRRAVTP